MIIFNEGVPRAGKSYDAVIGHILPALKAGRTVIARLNGLKHDLISDYLALELEAVQERLILIDSADVLTRFVAFRGEYGDWSLPAELKNCLIVIDECHEYYVAGKGGLPDYIEQFFALHGQHGIDVLLLSQFYKRLHPSVRGRVERKYVFQKLTAVGLKNRYVIRSYQTVAPDKYERVHQETRKYDPAIFPLYAGYAGDDVQTAVYDGGMVTVWRKLLPAAAVFGLLLVVGVWFFWSFISGDAGIGSPVASASAGVVASAPGAPVHAVSGVGSLPPDARAVLSDQPHIAYVLALSESARPRLAAHVQVKGSVDAGVVQWISDGRTVFDSLTFADLRSLGWGVVVSGNMALISQDGHMVLASAWPIDNPLAVPQRAIDQQRGAAASASLPSSGGSVATAPRVGGNYVPPLDTPRPRSRM